MPINYLRLIPGIIILALIVAVIGLKSERDKWRSNAAAQAEGRRADRATYERAQAEAALKNQTHVKKIEAEYEANTDALRSKFERDRERLRAQAGTPQGSAGSPHISKVPQAAGGTDGQELRISPEGLLRAQEIELQLNALIDWVRRQSEVAR